MNRKLTHINDTGGRGALLAGRSGCPSFRIQLLPEVSGCWNLRMSGLIFNLKRFFFNVCKS